MNEYTYFLSDVHIGLNQSENWYQQKAHEAHVQAILRYIAAKGKTVRDVVLLGDLFDTWEYASESSVPEPEAFLKECVKVNAPLFTPGKDGDLVSVLNAIGGDLWYINGNHDMTIPVGALNKTLNLTGKLIQGNLDPLKNFVYPSPDPNIYAEHGHRFSVMCRPDQAGNTDNAYYPLPLGYYVSRLAGTYCKKHLGANQTAADLLNSGNPSLQDLFHRGSTNSAETDAGNLTLSNQFSSFFFPLFLAFIGGDYRTQTFTMPDKKVLHANQEVIGYYPWMHTSDVLSAFSTNGIAFWSADVGNKLNSAAYNLCDLDKHNIVVLGHTHEPLLEQRGEGQRIYANTGYLCPSIPDVRQKGASFSFTEIQKDGAKYTVRMMCCNEDNTISGKAAIEATFENTPPPVPPSPSPICCNACQVVSNACVPTAPNKCQGGCTVMSFAL